jgi:hypothetical protein
MNVHLRRLWKADFSLATLAKDSHLVFCCVIVANHVVQFEDVLYLTINLYFPWTLSTINKF